MLCRKMTPPIAAAFLVVLVAACSERGSERLAARTPALAEGVVQAGVAATGTVLRDAPLTPARAELIELAFRAAAAIPERPHLKSRAKAQEQVVAACLTLDQPKRALDYLQQIGNWRRGAAYAELAEYCVRHALTVDVGDYLRQAMGVADGLLADPNEQVWRRDRIRAKVASAHVVLGQAERAAEVGADLIESEAGILQMARGARRDDFDQQIKEVDAAIAGGNLDHVRTALNLAAQLFDRHYEDPIRQERAEKRVRTGYDKLPAPLRVELLVKLIESALAHEGQGKAQELIEATIGMIDGVPWAPEDHIGLVATLAELRHRAGDEEKAQHDAGVALAMFDAKAAQIVDIYRAGSLRRLGAMFHAIGDVAQSHRAYRRALEAGVVNPNSVPRAQDLCATCLSMALSGYEPDAGMRARVAEILDGLGDPW